MDRLKTFCKALDTLSDGGLASGTITQIFGEKAIGKSILSFQSAFASASNGYSSIIIDTELSYHSYLIPPWYQKLSKRFGKEVNIIEANFERAPYSPKKKVSKSQLITALSTLLNQIGVVYNESQLSLIADILSPQIRFELDIKGPSIVILQCPDIELLLLLHGIDARKDLSSGGRVELRLNQNPTYDSPLRQLISISSAKLLIYDSLSAPFKSSFPSTQDLPARSSALAMLLSHAQRLCVDYGIAVLATGHVSIDPIQPWNRRPYGGVILGHEAKFSFEITKRSAKRNEEAIAINPEDESDNSRLIWLHRHPAIADYSRFGYMNIDDEGIH